MNVRATDLLSEKLRGVLTVVLDPEDKNVELIDRVLVLVQKLRVDWTNFSQEVPQLKLLRHVLRVDNHVLVPSLTAAGLDTFLQGLLDFLDNLVDDDNFVAFKSHDLLNEILLR